MAATSSIRTPSLRVHPVLGEVQLAPDLDRELVHHPRQIVDLQVREERLHPPCKRLQDQKIGLDQVDDPGALHLEGDDPAVPQHGPVHLREGGRRDRIGLDDVETLLKVRAVLPDLGQDLHKRERGNLVLQPLQLLDQFRGEKFPPGAHDLAELDVGWPQFLERKTDTLVYRPSLLSGFLGPPQPPDPGEDLLDQDIKTVLRQHIRNLPVAPEPGDHRDELCTPDT